MVVSRAHSASFFLLSMVTSYAVTPLLFKAAGMDTFRWVTLLSSHVYNRSC